MGFTAIDMVLAGCLAMIQRNTACRDDGFCIEQH